MALSSGGNAVTGCQHEEGMSPGPPSHLPPTLSTDAQTGCSTAKGSKFKAQGRCRCLIWGVTDAAWWSRQFSPLGLSLGHRLLGSS